MGILSGSENLSSIVTRPSLVPPPGDPSDARWQASFRHIYLAYHRALERYVGKLLARWRGYPPEDADVADIVQSYLVDCMEKGWLASTEDIRCFRAWISAQLRRYTIRWLDKQTAQKRRPARPFLGEEALQAVPAGPDPEAEAELSAGMVEVALRRCLETLAKGNADYGRLIQDLLHTDGEGSPDLAAELGRPPESMNQFRYRARRRFAILFWEEIRSTVRDEDDESFRRLQRELQPYLP